MLHDLPLIEQIAQLVSQLRMKYQVYIKQFYLLILLACLDREIVHGKASQ